MTGYRAPRRALVALFFSFALAGCPESSPLEVETPPPPPDDTTPPPPPPPAAQPVRVPHGTPVLFIATSSDASVYDHNLGDVIEGSRGAFVQIDPAAREATLVATTSSVSYAQSRTTLHTFDDEIYMLDVGETGARVRRLDKDDMRAGSDTPVPTPGAFDSVERSCFVVIGNDLVYKVAYRRAPFPGIHWADGPLVRVPNFFGGGQDVQELMPGLGGDSPSPGGFVTEACQFNMDHADGVWYDVSNRPVEDVIGIFERDAATGEPELVASVGGWSELDRYSHTRMGFDRGWVYIALLDVGTQQLAVIGSPVRNGLWSVLMEHRLTGFRADALHSIDVDDGHVGFVLRGADGDAVGLYSIDSDTFVTIGIGDTVNQLQVLYR